MTQAPFGYDKLDSPEILACLFHPRRDEDVNIPEGAIDHGFTVDEGVTLGARFFPGKGEDSPNILFFHGNGEIVSDYDQIGPMYVEHGLSLLAVDYRGYGVSGGSPTVTTMMRDGHTVFNEAQGWLKGIGRTGPLIVMGRSLGSAVAIDLAASYGEAIGGLIIESGFSRTVPLLQCLGVDTTALGITELDGFKHVEKIAQFSKPTLIMHARHDQIIPVVDAEMLQVHSAARSKEFHMIPGADHNTIMVQAGKSYFVLIRRFTDKIQGKRQNRFFRRKPRRGKDTVL